MRATGDPALDALLERELRYGQTRWTEIWLACVMTAFGAVLLGAGETFSLPPYRVIRLYVAEDVAGAGALAIGAARLAALWYNGRRRRSPLVRVAGCAAGFLFYAAMAIGFLLAGPPLPVGLVFGVLAVAELHGSSRSARDAVAYDSLGVRRRRRDRDQPAP
jgi:peptidoglycan/LPS O-acetylase OafA/YrhL